MATNRRKKRDDNDDKKPPSSFDDERGGSADRARNVKFSRVASPETRTRTGGETRAAARVKCTNALVRSPKRSLAADRVRN